MANVDITLLTSKRTYINVEGLDTVTVAQAGGYSVIAGENNATSFVVHYPTGYAGYNAYVYMKNSAGDYKTHLFGSLVSTDVEFTLPGEMTLEGNTYLVFYASKGSGENTIKAVWTPVVVPVTKTGVDYKKAAQASPEVLEQVMQQAAEAERIATAVAQSAENGEFDGKSAWVRFSVSADGSNMTTEWAEGQEYVGICIGHTASASPSDYNWMRFVGGSQCFDDESTTAVNYTVVNNVDKTFIASGITSVKLTIPAGITHGFHAGVNIHSGSTAPSFEFVNSSDKTLKVIQYGFAYDTPQGYRPSANVMICMSIQCDGKLVHVSIIEVPL